MATLAIQSLAARYGFGGDCLQTLLNDSRYSQADVAYIMGTSPQAFAIALAEVNASPFLKRLPRNWTKVAVVGTPCPWPPFQGQLAQVYSGPAEPGFTFGTPVYDPDTPHPIPSQND